MEAYSQMSVPQRFAVDCRGLATAMGRELWLEGRPIARLSGNRAKWAKAPMFLVFWSHFCALKLAIMNLEEPKLPLRILILEHLLTSRHADFIA